MASNAVFSSLFRKGVSRSRSRSRYSPRFYRLSRFDTRRFGPPTRLEPVFVVVGWGVAAGFGGGGGGVGEGGGEAPVVADCQGLAVGGEGVGLGRPVLGLGGVAGVVEGRLKDAARGLLKGLNTRIWNSEPC